MKETTLCYIERGGEYLMLHRTKKRNDENGGKWIGVGGHIEPGETPDECVLREAKEETGLTLTDCQARGIVDFHSDIWEDETMYLYTASEWTGELRECDEGDLEWIAKDRLLALTLWEGDRIFLKLLNEGAPFFRLSLYYRGEALTRAALNGEEL